MIYFVCVLIISVIFIGDLRVKNAIEKSSAVLQPEDGECSVLGGRILIRKHHNRGFVCNRWQNRQRTVAVLSLLLSVLMTLVFLLSFGQRGNHVMRTGLAFLLGGAFSNTYDRLKRKYVVDYFSLNVKWKRLRRIVFNISDFCIMTGALLTVIGSIR